MKKFAALLALGVVVAAPVHLMAQASVTGTWNTEFDTGIRNENGVETSMGKRKATMTLTQKGDSVFGTWLVVPDADAGGRAPTPVKLHGVRTGTKFVIETEPVARTIRMNDDEKQVKLITTYRFELKGDDMTGTSHNRSADGEIDSPERPFTAKRAKM